jgi:S1-C subfamily serine protease
MTEDELEQHLPDNPPDPADYDSQVIKALDSIVSVRTRIPEDGMTADVLGTEREGHGVVINDQGLVLTIGYVVTEANSVWLVDHQGTTMQGHVVAYDQQSGFGLVQALGKLSLPPVVLGKSADLTLGQPMLLAGCGGVKAAQQVQVGGIDEFAGYWEYLIDSAIFTVPAHPFWSGAALLGEDGMLYGIGSLILQTVDQDESVSSANMVIPIDLLPPVLNDLLLYGKRNEPARPWVGWFAQETGDGLIISGLTDDGPADRAGLNHGDRILQVEGKEVETLPELFKAVWSAGDAGVDITVLFERNMVTESTIVSTADRNARLKSASVH